MTHTVHKKILRHQNKPLSEYGHVTEIKLKKWQNHFKNLYKNTCEERNTGIHSLDNAEPPREINKKIIK